MGRISQLLNSPSTKATPAQDRSRRLWRETFATDKERGFRDSVQDRPRPNGYSNRSLLANPASFQRLLDAHRTGAPGGWSDDRWEQSKHFTGIVYAAVHRLCMRMIQAEFQVYHRDEDHPDGKRPVNRNDPPEGGRMSRPYELVELLQNPNRQDSFGRWLYRLLQQKLLTGTALNWMVPNRLGTPMEMYVIPTALAIPQTVINPEFPEGFYRIQPVYPYGPFSSYPTPATAVGAPVPAQWVLRFQYPHPLLRYEGYSPLTGLRLHVDELESIDRSRWYGMRRGIAPSAVLNFDGAEGMHQLPWEEIERIKAEFESGFQGPENSGALFVSAPGSSLEPWGGRPIDMDFQSGWEQLTSFILGAYGITKPAAGMIEDASYASLFATLKQLNLLTLDPECHDVASGLTKGMAHHFGDDLVIEIRCQRIDDHDVKNAKLSLLIGAQAITYNELRKELELPVTQEPWGSLRVGEMAQQEGGGAGAPEGSPTQGMAPAAPPGANGAANGAPPGREQMIQEILAGGRGGPSQPQKGSHEPREAVGPSPTNSGSRLGWGALGPRKALNGNGR